MVKYNLPHDLLYHRVDIDEARFLYDRYIFFSQRAFFVQNEKVLRVWFGDPHPPNTYLGPHNVYWTLVLHNCELMISICSNGETNENGDKMWVINAPNPFSCHTAMHLYSEYKKNSIIKKTRRKIYVTNNQ